MLKSRRRRPFIIRYDARATYVFKGWLGLYRMVKLLLQGICKGNQQVSYL